MIQSRSFFLRFFSFLDAQSVHEFRNQISESEISAFCKIISACMGELDALNQVYKDVTPFTGVWIEINQPP